MTNYDFEYKQGDSDTSGAILSDDNGLLDLTGFAVLFVMKEFSTGTPSYEISCTGGGTVNGVYYTEARGGTTIRFSKTETLAEGEYEGEFLVSGTDNNGDEWIRHIPSGNNFKSVKIWRSLKVELS